MSKLKLILKDLLLKVFSLYIIHHTLRFAR